MARFIGFLVVLFESVIWAATVFTWPLQTKRRSLYRVLSQPLFSLFMGGKISRSWDWVNVGDATNAVGYTGVFLRDEDVDNHLLAQDLTVVIPPDPDAPGRGKTWWSMALAMRKWRRCVLLVPAGNQSEMRIGFCAREPDGRGLVRQYCSIVFPPGCCVRVLRGPYTTTFFAIDIAGNPVPLVNGGEHGLWDDRFFRYPLI